MANRTYSRRDALKIAGLTGGAMLAGPLAPHAAWPEQTAVPPSLRGKAEACIFIWLSGGASHIDTWDPKRKSDRRETPGSYYDAIDTAIAGVQVCSPLQRMAPRMDRTVIVRTVHHDAVDEHAAATNLMHTGRPTSGTIVYPSIGSIVAHQKGPGGDGVPAYVVMGYPSPMRGPGFLGSQYGYVYLTETDVGPTGLTRPSGVGDARQERRLALLSRLRQASSSQPAAGAPIEEYAKAMDAGFRLAGPQFMSVFNLKEEPSSLREAYGSEFGQRLLLSRRLVSAGVRFIEVASNLNFVNGTGWDTHNEGQLKQHELIDDLDRGLSTLIDDLEGRKLLDKTLIVVATEFGRPPEFDGRGGRGHHSKAFSVLLAGGGMKTGQVVGETDELGRLPVARPTPVPDLHATIHAALGINPRLELYDNERPVPITDRGQAIEGLL